MGARRLHGSEGTPAFQLIFYLSEPICSKTVHRTFPFNPKLNIVAQNGDIYKLVSVVILPNDHLLAATYTQAF